MNSNEDKKKNYMTAYTNDPNRIKRMLLTSEVEEEWKQEDEEDEEVKKEQEQEQEKDEQKRIEENEKKERWKRGRRNTGECKETYKDINIGRRKLEKAY